MSNGSINPFAKRSQEDPPLPCSRAEQQFLTTMPIVQRSGLLSSVQSWIHWTATCLLTVVVTYCVLQILVGREDAAVIKSDVSGLSSQAAGNDRQLGNVSRRLDSSLLMTSQLASEQKRINTNLGPIWEAIMNQEMALTKLSSRLTKVELQQNEPPLETVSLTSDRSSTHRSTGAGLRNVQGNPERSNVIATIVTPSKEKVGLPSAVNLHHHNVDMSTALIRGAQVHNNGEGQKDYWLIPHPTASGSVIFSRVQPFETIPTGVRVHNIDDGNDYTITTFGEWLLK